MQSLFNTHNTIPLRGILALLIIMHHVSLCLTHQIPKDSPVMLITPFNYFGAPVVAVFFFMSGYGLMKNYTMKGKEYLDSFLMKRMSRILLPYILCCLLYLPFNDNIFWGYDTWRCDSPFLPTSWYVVAISICYVVFYCTAFLISKVLKKLPPPLTITVVFWVVLSYVQYKLRLMGYFGHWWNALLALSLGMTISISEDRILKYLNPTISVVLSLLLVAFCYYEGLDYVTFTIISLIVYIIVCSFGFLKNAIFNWLGSISYEIYLVQGVVTLHLFRCIGGHPLLYLCLSFVLSIVSAWLLNIIMTRIFKTIDLIRNK